MDKTRVFLSLKVNNKDVPHIKNIQEQLKSQLNSVSVKWEEPSKFHLTIRFLGDIRNDNIDSLRGTLNRLKFSFDEIKFKISGTGFFPGMRHPNVIYTELTESGNNSEELTGFIDRIIYNFGVKPENRFIPHITLGRFSRNKRIKIEKKPEINFEPIILVFSSFFLMKSELKQKGSVYSVIEEYNFNNQN